MLSLHRPVFRFHDCQNPLNQCFRLFHKTAVNNHLWDSAWRCVHFRVLMGTRGPMLRLEPLTSGLDSQADKKLA